MEHDTNDWISSFLATKGNELFCRIDHQYIKDDINTTRKHNLELLQQFPYYQHSLHLILNIYIHDESQVSDKEQQLIENDAKTLYGLMHSRFILTERGLDSMLNKYNANEFGTCPRYYCKSQPVIPIGISDEMDTCSVQLYCVKCNEIYTPKSIKHKLIDGSYFGTTFAHLFFLIYPQLKKKKKASTNNVYIPRAFGFKLHKTWHYKSMEAAKHAEIQYKKRKVAEQTRKQQVRVLQSKLNENDDDEQKEKIFIDKYIWTNCALSMSDQDDIIQINVLFDVGHDLRCIVYALYSLEERVKNIINKLDQYIQTRYGSIEIEIDSITGFMDIDKHDFVGNFMNKSIMDFTKEKIKEGLTVYLNYGLTE